MGCAGPVHTQFHDPIERFGNRVQDLAPAEEENLRNLRQHVPKKPDGPDLGLRFEAVEGITEEHLLELNSPSGGEIDEREPEREEAAAAS